MLLFLFAQIHTPPFQTGKSKCYATLRHNWSLLGNFGLIMSAMLPSLKTIFMTNGCRENFPVFCNFSFTVILFNNSDFSLLGFTNKMQLNFTILGPGDKKIWADTIGIHGVLLSLWVGRVADTRPCSPHSCLYI